MATVPCSVGGSTYDPVAGGRDPDNGCNQYFDSRQPGKILPRVCLKDRNGGILGDVFTCYSRRQTESDRQKVVKEGFRSAGHQ
jgi:hypothetical protein